MISRQLCSTETANVVSTTSTSTSAQNAKAAYTFSQVKQAPHPTAMIPGPIEFDDEVLTAMSHPSQAHTGAPFIKTFQETLQLVRKLFCSTDPEAQGFVVAGSGTLGWDFVGANLIEQNENALLINTGFFSESFSEALSCYGANVDELKPNILGETVPLSDIEAAVKSKNYKLIAITHVDTSTGVLSDIEAIAKVVKRVSPQTLIVVDGVCSVAVEPIKFDDWKLDFVLTASQKGVGAPSGLSICFASAQALAAVKARTSKPSSFFASIPKWLPIMRAYEAGNPAYFATPPVQNIYGLRASLRQYVHNMDARFESHRIASDYLKNSLAKMGLKTVSLNRESSAHGMTAVYLPEGITNPQLLPLIGKRGVTLAGGIHKEIVTKYFRIGHMGISAVYSETGHIDKVISAISESLQELGYQK